MYDSGVAVPSWKELRCPVLGKRPSAPSAPRFARPLWSVPQDPPTHRDGTSAATLKKGSETTVDGKPVIDVTGKHDGMDLTLSVSTQGTPFPVRATSKGDGDSQTTNFTFDQPVPDKTPPAGETVP